MKESSIYGEYKQFLNPVLSEVVEKIHQRNREYMEATGKNLFEHLSSRIKTEKSMEEKWKRRGLALEADSALRRIQDAVGIRIICGFVDDIYKMAEEIAKIEGIQVVKEKNYVLNAKPNGYRSYHMILDYESEYPDCLGRERGHYFIEVQIRTLAMDSWASLEHQIKYKQNIKNEERITKELKRCADELASCDISMQTIRNLIEKAGEENEDSTGGR